MINKAVVPTAGLGTRLFPATKEEPKEMMPLFARINGWLSVKPLLQMAFESLFDGGIREYCLITGRTKRAIEDHFTEDRVGVEWLRSKGKEETANSLHKFYTMLQESAIVWINQPEPMGFGDAVDRAMPFVKCESFIVHAGDTLILSKHGSYIRHLINMHLERKADATFFIKQVENPSLYGVVEVENVDQGAFKVKRTVEKPEMPPSNLAIVPVYAFNPVIFEALKETSTDGAGEKQLTNAIQTLIEWGFGVYAIELKADEGYLDIGTPETYWHALKISYEFGEHR